MTGEGIGSVETLLARLREGRCTPGELAEEALRRARSAGEQLGAFQELVDRPPTPRGDSHGLLWGIPYALKGNIAQKGHRLDCESRILRGHRASYDATAHRRLLEAGAVCVGRTRMDEFAMGSSGERAVSGATFNPWDRRRVPGGSSSGSAVAVAAGIVPFALGSDTGGSIRQPAALCGCVGLKPSWGRVSRYGLVAFASSLDGIGPLTRTVRDAALVAQVIMGPDPRDATTLPDRPENLLEGPGSLLEGSGAGLDGVVVGVPWELLEGHLSEAVEAEFRRVLSLLETAGARCVDQPLPLARHALAVYAVLANAEASSNLARFDGLRWGSGSKDSTGDPPGEGERAALAHERGGSGYRERIRRARAEALGEEVKLRILLGTFVLSEGYHQAYYQRAQRIRRAMAAEADAALARCDVLAWPTTGETAFLRGQRLDDPLRMYDSDFLTVQANLTGLPAISLPTGLSPEGLPFSLQLTGRRWREDALLRVARGVEELCGFAPAYSRLRLEEEGS